LKILHVTYSDKGGGAAIAVARLDKALIKQGIDSSILSVRCSEKTKPSIPAFGSIKLLLNQLENKFSWRILQNLKCTGFLGPCSLNLFPTGIHKKINASDADIIHLHWVNAEMISIEEIAKIKKPVVWTLHDMWAFCGIEHCSENLFFKNGYQLPLEKKPWKWHWMYRLDQWTWKRKKKAWKNCAFHFVTPGRWLANCVQSSQLLAQYPVEIIPNPFDINRFSPQNQSSVRETLKLPQNTLLVLIGAAALNARHKGIDLFIESLDYIQTSFEIVVFGGELKTSSKHIIHQMGAIWDEEKMASLYSAVDLFVLPSRIDNFPSTGVESLACGTPVVAFNIGGLPDMIDHKKNGYLATPFDVKDLAHGIDWILKQLDTKNKTNYQTLCSNAREKVVCYFSEEIVINHYKNLFLKILAQSKKGQNV